ncbi:MAG: metal-dependent hydrolase [Ignavibacteriae bacterium]|nr:metal-dependent hydrolase [Ignavibacteriota bacterium]
MKLTYYGHSAFLLQNGSTNILIDPFLDGNPLSPVRAEQVNAHYIIVTHGHGDHLGDAIPIAKRCNATIVAINELADYVASKGAKAHNMHIGGSHQFPFGRIKFTIAHHGSCAPDGTYTGNPSGVLITINGKTIYHTGDTGLFYDMKLIGEMNPVDVMLLPIGDNFTMGIDDAVKAVELTNPKFVIPMHYNTFPVINADPNLFLQGIQAKGFRGTILQPGDSLDI